MALPPQKRFELITRGLEEVIGGEALLKLIEDNERPPRAYWGTAPTGRPHVGYLVPLTKLADFLRAGVTVKVLIADIHAFLDNLKAPFELVKFRAQYYERLLVTVLQAIGVPTKQLHFVLGSSYQLRADYNMDNYRLTAMVTEHDAKKAGAEVVKQVASPLISGLLYPGLQALDEQYLDVDFQFGGVDQRKIFMFAEQYLPKLGYQKRAHLMNAMVPGMNGSKMSSSDVNSKIDFLDSPADIKRKVMGAYCMEGEVEDNGVLAFVGSVLLPISRLRTESVEMGDAPSVGVRESFVHADAPKGTLFSIARPEKYGGPLHYSSHDDLVRDFTERKLHPADLKKGVIDALTKLLEPVQKMYQSDTEFQKIKAQAYPEDEPKQKKKKPQGITNPRIAACVLKSEGGTAETEEEAKANAAKFGLEYRGAKGKKKNVASDAQQAPSQAAEAVQELKIDG